MGQNFYFIYAFIFFTFALFYFLFLKIKKKQSRKNKNLNHVEICYKKNTQDKKTDKKNLFSALALVKSDFFLKIKNVLSSGFTDEKCFNELEEILIKADIGIKVAMELISAVRNQLKNVSNCDEARLQEVLKNEIRKKISVINHGSHLNIANDKPTVYLFVGVNGAGKTTTIGKLAHNLIAKKKSVLMAAGDTFRAAAADQLSVWAKRVGSVIYIGENKTKTPASVIFDAVKKAKASGIDYVLCDTAGRLHTKGNLMLELSKINKSLEKICPGAPHEVLLVLDASIGQNSIYQAKEFLKFANVTGLIITKLDGTARGGAVIGIVDELRIPIRFIGTGEKLEDLRSFETDEFIDAFFS